MRTWICTSPFLSYEQVRKIKVAFVGLSIINLPLTFHIGT